MSLSMRTTRANHTVRAMMSMEPDKRVVAELVTTNPLLLVCSVLDAFMYLSLTKIPALPLAKSVAGRGGYAVLNPSPSTILPQIRPRNVTACVTNSWTSETFCRADLLCLFRGLATLAYLQ